MKVTDLTAQLAQPLVEAAGCTLWDVEYVREGGTWYLRVFIDAPEGVNIDQCEAVSRHLSFDRCLFLLLELRQEKREL